IQKDRNLSGKRVLLIDDLIATGGSLSAAESLVNMAGGSVCGALCLIELTGLKGREKLDCPVDALQSYLY
ncbi:MAG: adenine phosphoribosyltransferase, partial [Alphaproteobacteria bacterium]|nr:adenine phosphoribosyltransferase [Alphaproteobacteria bacterium]